MAYNSGIRLPGESASKLGHLSVVKSPWVQELINEFENAAPQDADQSGTEWISFEPQGEAILSRVWAVDGSFVPVSSQSKSPKEVAFVKTALLSLDQTRLDKIDKINPHPLLLQEILADSAIFHATVFPLKNINTKMGSNYNAVRHIIRDSMKIDEHGAFYETLKWLSYQKWNITPSESPSFHCPHCHTEFSPGFTYDLDQDFCSHCNQEVFLTDMLGFHLDMDEDSAPESVASSYMLIMEHLMLFTAIRIMWEHSDKSLVTNTLFIKDGPLTLRGQYSKLIPRIRNFLHYAKDKNRPIHIIGQEKSGAFHDHLGAIADFTSPLNHGEPMSYAVLSHEYVRREVYRSPDLQNPYGSRTNWGEKVFIKFSPGTFIVVNVPTGHYDKSRDFPAPTDLIGLNRILATIPSLLSRKYEGALYPVELANGIASLSNYPSAKILQRFVEGK